MIPFDWMLLYVKEFVALTNEALGSPQVLVNNAGLFTKLTLKSLLEIESEASAAADVGTSEVTSDIGVELPHAGRVSSGP